MRAIYSNKTETIENRSVRFQNRDVCGSLKRVAEKTVDVVSTAMADGVAQEPQR
jgi:hypothetical protein